MIKNVIFDLGDVLINNSPLEYIKTLGYSEEKTQELYQALSTDSLWHDKDIGIYESYVECIPMFQEHHPQLKEEIAEFFRDSWMEKVFTPIEENMVLYERARELGYAIFYLTNYSKDGFAHLEEHYDFIRNANGKIVSSHVHCCKPDLRIYELLLEKYQLNASECLFFDDNNYNVLAAKELGIYAVLFTNVEEALHVLNSGDAFFSKTADLTPLFQNDFVILAEKEKDLYFVVDNKSYRLSCYPGEPCLYICYEDNILITIHNSFTTSDIHRAAKNNESIRMITGKAYDIEGICTLILNAIRKGKASVDILDVEVK